MVVSGAGGGRVGVLSATGCRAVQGGRSLRRPAAYCSVCLPAAAAAAAAAAAVYADGGICLDILQNQWSPIYDVSAILTSIQSLLSDPNPNSPANSEVRVCGCGGCDVCVVGGAWEAVQ